MSDLTDLRDHAQRLADSEHRDDCESRILQSGRFSFRIVRPDPDCPGCMPARERALWQQIADELDDYLAGDDDGQEALC